MRLLGLLLLNTFITTTCFAQVTYSYDGGAHLVQADYGGGVVLVYSYDAAGNLISRQLLSATNPLLMIVETHQGNFTRGEINATYTVTVSNTAAAGPTSGTLTVTETVSPGLTLVSMNGTGWTCDGDACSRADILNPGSSYPAITVAVKVVPTAASPQVSAVSLATGGLTKGSATDLTLILPPGRCDANADGLVNVADIQTLIDMAADLIPSTAAAELTGDSVVSVADLQVIINVVLGRVACPNQG